jgi:hypothetical protein
MPMKYFFILVPFLLFGPLSQQEKSTEFCSSRTPAAYHSPDCDWGYVVNDSGRFGDVKIPHRPPYHTYSRWVVGDRTYVFAYRDIDDRPDDMVADIYIAEDSHYKLIGNTQIPGIVTAVSTAKLTGDRLPDVVFRFQGGELQYVNIVRLSDEKAEQVFQYGASAIELLSEPKPLIEATSKISNVVEQFAWDPQSYKFRRTSQRPLRKPG